MFRKFLFKSLARCCLQIVLLFENMDLDKETIGRILARCPEIFASSINKTLQRKIEFLGRVGICKAFLPGVIRKYPELLVSDIDKTLILRYCSDSSILYFSYLCFSIIFFYSYPTNVYTFTMHLVSFSSSRCLLF